MRSAWVIGGQGFLGRYVARQLAASGWRVAGVGHGAWRDAADASQWGLSLWRTADIDPRSLRDLATTAGPPALIFHAAGSRSVGFSLEQPLADFERTVATTAMVLEFMRTLAPTALLIYPSSAAVYGVTSRGPIPETSLPAPVSPYGVHKLMAEQLCLSAHQHFGLRCAIIRYFSIYGPGLRKQLIWDLACNLAGHPREVSLHGTGEETRDFLHVEDAAHIAALVSETAGETPLVINGGSGQAVTVREVAETVATLAGQRSVIRFTGAAQRGDPPHYQADVRQLGQLGFRPKWSLHDGLRAYVEWLLQSGLDRT